MSLPRGFRLRFYFPIAVFRMIVITIEDVRQHLRPQWNGLAGRDIACASSPEGHGCVGRSYEQKSAICHSILRIMFFSTSPNRNSPRLVRVIA